MRIYQLVTDKDRVIHNSQTGHTLVVTPQGAVYNTEDTSDVRNMSVAFGVLATSIEWREATEEEIQELRDHPPVSMLELNWVIPTRPKPNLTVITGGKAEVVYDQGGLKIYDDDDTQ